MRKQAGNKSAAEFLKEKTQLVNLLTNIPPRLEKLLNEGLGITVTIIQGQQEGFFPEFLEMQNEHGIYNSGVLIKGVNRDVGVDIEDYFRGNSDCKIILRCEATTGHGNNLKKESHWMIEICGAYGELSVKTALDDVGTYISELACIAYIGGSQKRLASWFSRHASRVTLDVIRRGMKHDARQKKLGRT